MTRKLRAKVTKVKRDEQRLQLASDEQLCIRSRGTCHIRRAVVLDMMTRHSSGRPFDRCTHTHTVQSADKTHTSDNVHKPGAIKEIKKT